MTANRKDRRARNAMAGTGIKLMTTYKELVDARDALNVLGKLEGLSQADKFLFAKTVRMLKGDIDDYEKVTRDILHRYIDKSHQRQVADLKARANKLTDPDTRQAALEAADEVPKPQQVMGTEAVDWDAENDKLKWQEVEVEIPKRILMSKLIGNPRVLPEHLAALLWMIEEDVSIEELEKVKAP